MEKKYELIPDTEKRVDGPLFRIKALRDIPRYNVKKGDIGGLVGSEYNLSQEGDCWIADDAAAVGLAQVKDNAILQEDAYACGLAVVKDNACLRDAAKAEGRAIVQDNATMWDLSTVSGNAILSGNASLYEQVLISGDAQVSGNAELRDYVCCDFNTKIGGDVLIVGYSVFSKNVVINSNSDFAVFTNIPGVTKPMVLTWVRNIDRWFLRELYPEDTFFSDDGYASDELPDDIITHCEPLIDFINKIKTIG